MTRLTLERPGLVSEVLARITKRGRIAAGDASPDGQRRKGPTAEGGRMWNWQDSKIAIEWLFCTGQVTTATRKGFERIYDLTERVLPPDVLNAPAPSAEDAQRELLRIAASRLGVGTEKQMRRYLGLSGPQPKEVIAELVDAGELAPVRVEGTRMLRWAEATAPSQIEARALLSPFDLLIWDRDRTLRLFDFHYRISLYTPAAQRGHGYYVLPFLLGDKLVARVDLKADRRQSALLVPVVTAEPGVDQRDAAAELADELRLMADWLELDKVVRAGPVREALAAPRSDHATDHVAIRGAVVPVRRAGRRASGAPARPG
jgi:uncharacterized protein